MVSLPGWYEKMGLFIFIRAIIWAVLSILVMKLSKNMIHRNYGGEHHVKNIAVGIASFQISFFIGIVAAIKSESMIIWYVLMVSYLALLSAARFDIELYIIPNMIPCFLIACKLLMMVYLFFVHENVKDEVIGSVLGCVVCLMILTIAGFFSHGGVGKGDVKLLSALGFACGLYPTIVTLIAALICCTVIALLLIGLKKVSWKDHLPFGPFIFLGYVIMICYI